MGNGGSRSVAGVTAINTARARRGRAAQSDASQRPPRVRLPEEVAHAKAQREVKAATKALEQANQAHAETRREVGAASQAGREAEIASERALQEEYIHARAQRGTRAPQQYARLQAARAARDAAHGPMIEARARVEDAEDKRYALVRQAHPEGHHLTDGEYRALARTPEYRVAQAEASTARKAYEAASRTYYGHDSDVRRLEAQLSRGFQTPTREAIAQHPLGREAKTRLVEAYRRADTAREARDAAQTRLERAQEAEAQAAGRLDIARGGVGVLTTYENGTARARRALTSVLGDRASPRMLADITGAHVGDSLRVAGYDARYLRDAGFQSAVSLGRTGANDSHADYTLARLNAMGARRESLHAGDLIMNVGLVRSSGKTTTSGRELVQSIGALQQLGVQRIHASAARGANLNGYYTWAQIGGEGDIPHSVLSAAQLAFGTNVTRVEQLVDRPGGLAWWREHGDTFHVTLNIGPGGRTAQVLSRYQDILSKRAARQGA